MELSIEGRKQPGHLDYEHSGDPLMTDVQKAFEGLEADLKISSKKSDIGINREADRLRALKSVLEKNLIVPADEGMVKININALLEAVKDFRKKL